MLKSNSALKALRKISLALICTESCTVCTGTGLSAPPSQKRLLRITQKQQKINKIKWKSVGIAEWEGMTT